MIGQVQFATVWVRDQEKALDFYVNKLGFEKLQDAPFEGGMRWIEVRPQDAQTGHVLAMGYGAGGQEEARIGNFTGIVFRSENVQATYEELSGRGVHFTETPSMQFWGEVWAQFVDQDGNAFGLGGK